MAPSIGIVTVVSRPAHAPKRMILQAQADVKLAYDDAAGRATDVNLSGQDLGGMTLAEGVYTFDAVAELTGTLTFDAEGRSDSVFIVQAGSALATASSSSVALINGAQACRVFC